MVTRGAIKAYNKSNIDSAAAASPYKVVQLLFGGVIDKLGQAKGFIEQGEIAAKGEAIGRVTEILLVLQASLDHEVGGEVSGNLDALYDYLILLLAEGNAANDISKLDEVMELVIELKSAWDAIPVEAQSAA